MGAGPDVRRPHTAGHQLHFDSANEGNEGRQGAVSNPLVSSVLYLTDAVGGPTLVTPQRFMQTRMAQHGDRVTALQISSDSRWLISASLDGCLRVWDIAASHCLQALRLGAPITAFSLSPALDMLATCHINSDVPVDLALPSLAGGSQASSTKGVDLRASDKGQGSGGPQAGAGSGVRIAGQARAEGDRGPGGPRVADEGAEEGLCGEQQQQGEVRSSDEDEGYADVSPSMPAASSEVEGLGVEGEVAGDEEAGQKLDVRGSGAPQPLAPSMVTLSLLPRAQWQSLVQLEEIKARNK
ncbi:uncharacterized protein HaLaN_16096 [Haematococcus lacustris]|uniref:WDR36/Utp21 C-terminal domain-containing protein n=1 Tax=Haematococcus lacustris TaxID=44745 RepID=A0A699ZI60_HAELA|nr:uncharacterized protein HaLaN_16096 [Haematococcus lacustris]